MTNNTPVAIVTALVAAAVLGLSAAIDQRSTKKVKTREPLSPRLILDLVRQPLWLIAIGANVVGFILQVVALAYGSLALVQPLLVCDLLFAVLIAWVPEETRERTAARHEANLGRGRRYHDRPGGIPRHRAADARPHAGPAEHAGAARDRVRRGRGRLPRRREPERGTCGRWRWRLGCGVSYGVAAFVIKLLTSEFGGGLGAVFTNWPIYVFIVVGPAGFILNQNALQQGTLLAPVQAIISVADPVISIALGIAWLDVRLRSSPAAIAGEVISFLLLTVGIVMTSRVHVADPPAQQEAAEGVTGKQQ